MAAGPPGPGEGIAPPGDCTAPGQYVALVRGGDGDSALARLTACVAACLDVMVTCFKGGDRRHLDQLDLARKDVVNYACRVAKNCGGGGP